MELEGQVIVGGGVFLAAIVSEMLRLHREYKRGVSSRDAVSYQAMLVREFLKFLTTENSGRTVDRLLRWWGY